MKNQNILRYTKLYIIWVLISLFNFSIVNATISSNNLEGLSAKRIGNDLYELYFNKVYKGTIDKSKIKLAFKNIDYFNFNLRNILKLNKGYIDYSSLITQPIFVALLHHIAVNYQDLLNADPALWGGILAGYLGVGLYKERQIRNLIASIDPSKKRESINVGALLVLNSITGFYHEKKHRDELFKYLITLDKDKVIPHDLFHRYRRKLINYSTHDDQDDTVGYPALTIQSMEELNLTDDEDLEDT